VTRGHARRSRGGLWFRSYPEFAATVAWLQAHPQQADRMGRNGRRYVLHNYTWDLVLARFERLVHAWGVVDG
jgi:glycosyltransferase involved in cell wall biosynthesis